MIILSGNKLCSDLLPLANSSLLTGFRKTRLCQTTLNLSTSCKNQLVTVKWTTWSIFACKFSMTFLLFLVRFPYHCCISEQSVSRSLLCNLDLICTLDLFCPNHLRSTPFAFPHFESSTLNPTHLVTLCFPQTLLQLAQHLLDQRALLRLD